MTPQSETSGVLEDLAALLADQGRMRFLDGHRDPWLLETATAIDIYGPRGDTTIAVPAGTGHVAIPLRARCWPVMKRTVEWPEKITIGRGAANDIVVRNPAVSQVHAFLVRHGGRHLLVDAKSKNGTELDGEPLPPLGRSPVESGQSIRFGGAVTALFCSPAEFCVLLESGRFGRA